MVRLSDVVLEPPAVGLLGLRNFELPAVGLPELCKQLLGDESGKERLQERNEEEREGDADCPGRRSNGSHPDSGQGSHLGNS